MDRERLLVDRCEPPVRVSSVRAHNGLQSNGPPAADDADAPERLGFRDGCVVMLPLAASAAAFDLVYGALARQAGFSPAEATLMSGLVWAGTAQFVVVDLWASPPPVVPILFATLVVNLRHLPMGATLRPVLGGRGTYPALAFLSDETWALTLREARRGRAGPAFMIGGGAVLWVGWVAATCTGAIAGARISDPTRWGLDFAFTALLAALLVTMTGGRRGLTAAFVAAAVALPAARWLPPGWSILLGGLAGTAAGAWRDAD